MPATAFIFLGSSFEELKTADKKEQAVLRRLFLCVMNKYRGGKMETIKISVPKKSSDMLKKELKKRKILFFVYKKEDKWDRGEKKEEVMEIFVISYYPNMRNYSKISHILDNIFLRFIKNGNEKKSWFIRWHPEANYRKEIVSRCDLARFTFEKHWISIKSLFLFLRGGE